MKLNRSEKLSQVGTNRYMLPILNDYLSNFMFDISRKIVNKRAIAFCIFFRMTFNITVEDLKTMCRACMRTLADSDEFVSLEGEDLARSTFVMSAFVICVSLLSTIPIWTLFLSPL